MPPARKDTYRYQLKDGNRIVHIGVTSDPARREVEHRTRWPSARINTVGTKTTRAEALRWERTKLGA